MNSKVQHATTHGGITSVSVKMDFSLSSPCINVKVKRMNIYSILVHILWIKTKTFKSTACLRLLHSRKTYGLNSEFHCMVVIIFWIYFYKFLFNLDKCLTTFNPRSFLISDVNECDNGEHKCDNQTTTCSNKLGHYTCQCKNGYQPEQSLYKCRGKPVTLTVKRAISDKREIN